MNVELDAAEALLDSGVSVPFKAIRLPFCKRRLQLRFIMKRPGLGGQIRIARHYIKLGYTVEQIEAFSKEEDMAFLAAHGKRLSIMIALTVCRGLISGIVFTPIVAFIVRWCVSDVFIEEANLRFISLMGTRRFMNIIKSAEMMNPMRPRLSQTGKGS